jgi:hypothetical protein
MRKLLRDYDALHYDCGMTRKRLIVIAGLLVMLASAGLFVALDHRPSLTRANFDRIQIGMTEAEVTAIFGRPPAEIGGIWGDLAMKTHQLQFWLDHDGRAVVGFTNSTGCRVVASTEWIAHARRETALEKIRRWLRLN